MIPAVSGPVNLKDKVIIVTGASRGIGRAIALAFFREGAIVVLVDIASLEETAHLMSCSDRVFPVSCDLNSPEEIKNAIWPITNKFKKIDVLVNNAAVVGSYGKELEDFDLEEWEKIMNTNLRSTFLMTRAVWPCMKKQGAGKIVCMGSIAGKIGGLFAGPHYCASKGGIHGFVKWAAKNGARHGIHVNGIAPGPIVTAMTVNEPLIKDEMIPLGRLGQPADIAETVVFLSSQASNFITGCVLDVNGGLLMA
ncbi:MAG: SDR family oxidoreductase [Deltaproteobacteria bacterium]|nr:SDR family oxidoreductase [Deltaproteobacteria bacterium]